MVCVKKDREVELLAQTAQQSGNLADSYELALTFDTPIRTGTFNSCAAENTALN